MPKAKPPRRTPSSPYLTGTSSEPPLELEVGMMAMIEDSLENFEAFVRSEALSSEHPLKSRLQALLDDDHDVFRMLFASGVVSGVETMTSLMKQASDLAEAQHQAQHHGRPIGRA